MDFSEELFISRRKDVLLVVMDKLTKYAHFLDLKHPYIVAIVAPSFIDNVFKLHRLPHTIVSDRDLIFTSKF